MQLKYDINYILSISFCILFKNSESCVKLVWLVQWPKTKLDLFLIQPVSICLRFVKLGCSSCANVNLLHLSLLVNLETNFIFILPVVMVYVQADMLRMCLGLLGSQTYPHIAL